MERFYQMRDGRRGDGAEMPDYRYRPLLRVRRAWPDGNAAKQRDELASSHALPSAEGHILPNRYC
jgi:hypothetical protein